MIKKVINIKSLDIEKIIKSSTLEDIFQMNFDNAEWIWVNRDIFFDIVYNVLEYDSVVEEDLKREVRIMDDDVFVKNLNYKFKELGWTLVNQKLFEELVEDFISTKDIETYIYVNKRFYTKKIIKKTNELNWILKAMAVDTFQQLALEDKNLIQIYEEYFNENGMIIEEMLLTGEYKLNVATWKLDTKSNLLEFYKLEERYSQWSEGNSNFMFNELSK